MSTNPGPGSSPLVQRRRLRTELRRARGETRLTQDQVANAMDWSLSKVIRIETGAVGISTNDLRALLNLYEISDSNRIDELIELARVSRQTSWWSRYREDISSQYFQFIEYEEAASIQRIYEPLIVPGLLQTPEYADTVVRRLAPPDMPEAIIRTRVEIRLKRQQVLEQAAPPTLIFALGESAIQYLLGEGAVARGQVARLIEIANRPNITIEIVPFSAGLCRGMDESFTILEFPDPEDGDVFFTEGPGPRDMIVSHDESGDITAYREILEQLRGISLRKTGTLAYLRNLAG
jgi:transcriptional regulator with XRE-family HTH domain